MDVAEQLNRSDGFDLFRVHKAGALAANIEIRTVSQAEDVVVDLILVDEFDRRPDRDRQHPRHETDSLLIDPRRCNRFEGRRE